MQTRYEVPPGERDVFDTTLHAPPPAPEAARVPSPLMVQVIVLGVNRAVPENVLSVDGVRVNVTCPEVTGLSARSLIVPVYVVVWAWSPAASRRQAIDVSSFFKASVLIAG
jgi:hypothetical protein